MPAHFYANGIMEPVSPRFLEKNLCSPNARHPEFFHGTDSARYQTRSNNAFIFNRRGVPLPRKAFALHGVILFPINSQKSAASI